MNWNTVECPYCEHENDMSDGLTDLPSDNRFDTECEICEKEFEVEVEFNPSYLGSKIEYQNCDLCIKSVRDIKEKGRIFPFPKHTSTKKLCDGCWRKLMRNQYELEKVKS
ncbi:hypothetical protein [Sporosarcina sp. FSL K6-3508]|uniref:hypothetical protein n=1 Tax=Sporosarcina sp. FSL K6-3508 TaxID=2921557 RepID=UPI00315AA682